MRIHCTTVKKGKIHKTILLSLIWELINMNHDAYLMIKYDKTIPYNFFFKVYVCAHMHIDTHIHFLEAHTELGPLGKKNQELGRQE